MSRTRAGESPQDRRTKFLLRKWGLSRATALADAARNQGADVPSAPTLNLIAIYSNVSGTTTVNAIGELPVSVVRQVRFTGAVPLVHSANLLLPGAGNHTAGIGDTAQFTSLGGGIWNCDWYKNADGTPFLGLVDIPHGGTGKTTAMAAKDALTTQSTDIPSATVTDMSLATGEHVTVTGTATINEFGTLEAAGPRRLVTFDGSLTLVHDETKFFLPTEANIQTQQGDVAEFVYLGE